MFNASQAVGRGKDAGGTEVSRTSNTQIVSVEGIVLDAGAGSSVQPAVLLVEAGLAILASGRSCGAVGADCKPSFFWALIGAHSPIEDCIDGVHSELHVPICKRVFTPDVLIDEGDRVLSHISRMEGVLK